MEFFICDKCDGKQFKNELGLLRHLNRHGVTVQDYRLHHKYKGVKPLCKCGCGKETKWGPELSDFRDYIPGHQSRVNNNFTTEKSQANSKATRAKMKEEGTLKGIASIKLKQGRSDRMKGNKNIMFDKEHTDSTKEKISTKKKTYFANNPEAKKANRERSKLYWSEPISKEKQRERYFVGSEQKLVQQRHDIGEAKQQEKKEGKQRGVYLIQLPLEQEFLYKIGYTETGPYSRMVDIQRNIPINLTLKHFFQTDNPKKLEKKLHKFFCLHRRMGEWFSLSLEQVASFESVCSTNDL